MQNSSKESKKQTKKYLRSLTHGDRRHPIRDESRIVKYGFRSFSRNIWLSLASILVTTITLMILVVTAISNVILGETAATLRDRIDITIFLQPGTDNRTLATLSSTLATDPNVREDTILTATSEENTRLEVDKLVEKYQSDTSFVETLKTEDMYASFIKEMPSTIRFKVHDTTDLTSVKTLVSTDSLFQSRIHPDTVNYSPTYDMNQAEIATINSWARIAKNGGIILGIIFLVISILVNSNTIRMAIFSRREEIYMMKLIGGSRSFIRGPFVVEAGISGAISGILTCAISYFGFELLAPRLTRYGIESTSILGFYNQPIALVLAFAAIIIIGITISSIAANFASEKYLRKL